MRIKQVQVQDVQLVDLSDTADSTSIRALALNEALITVAIHLRDACRTI